MRKRALFLDRDGVINVDRGYVYKPEEFEWIPGVFDLVRVAADLGLLTVVVTNQAGIARGHFTEEDFHRTTAWMKTRFAQERAPIAAVYFCPYHTDGIGQYRVANHPDRKPNPGMIQRAACDLNLDLPTSFLVGDKEWDIEAAQRAGIGASCLFGGDTSIGSRASICLKNHRAVIEWLIASERCLAAPH